MGLEIRGRNVTYNPESWNISGLMPVRKRIGDPSADHPKSLFQLSGVHYRGLNS